MESLGVVLRPDGADVEAVPRDLAASADRRGKWESDEE
jgi:hypothetical protein